MAAMATSKGAGCGLAAAIAGAAWAVAAAAAELPPLPPAQDVRQRPTVEMLPPGVRRPARGFSLVDPALAPRAEPPPPPGPIDFGDVGSGPRGLQFDPVDPARRR